MAGADVKDLPGWADDDHGIVLSTYLRTASPDDPAHGIAQDGAGAFFEKHFEAKLVARNGILTGYFEPIYEGALERSETFSVPVYGLPEGWRQGEIFAARSEIEDHGLLDGRELAWLKSPIDAFFLQVQGSGRVRLADAAELRLGYAGKNGQVYVSLGKLLLESGEIGPDDISMQAIREWFSVNPERGVSYLRKNPNYVFFRLFDDLSDELGPIGTAGVPLMAHRSIAVDTDYTRLGSLAFIAPGADGPAPRLCVAQDTGAAIKGSGRADLFCGTGDAAAEQAGRLHTSARFFQLVPKRTQ